MVTDVKRPTMSEHRGKKAMVLIKGPHKGLFCDGFSITVELSWNDETIFHPSMADIILDQELGSVAEWEEFKEEYLEERKQARKATKAYLLRDAVGLREICGDTITVKMLTDNLLPYFRGYLEALVDHAGIKTTE